MGRTPLIGRASLVSRVSALLDDGANVALRGPPGIGKTRLAAEVVGLPGMRERVSDRLLGSPATAHRALSTVAPLLPAGTSSLDLVDLYAWLLSYWQRRAGPAGPVLVWLDDAQDADSLSAAILRHAVSVGAIQLLATHRTPQALPADLHALGTEDLVLDVDLPPLEPHDCLTLARASAVGRLDEGRCARVLELSGGNPLFVRELARVVTASDEDGAWGTLDTLVGRQVEELDVRTRRVLELVAAAEPVPAELFVDDRQQLAPLLRSGLVQHQGAGLLRVDHPVRSAWVLHRLGPVVADAYRELLERGRAAGVLDSLDPVTVVDWQLRAGEPPSQETAVQAARLAIARADGDTALRIARVLDEPVRSLLRGEALICRGDVARGVAELDTLRHSADLPVQVEAASWQIRYRGLILGEFETGHRLLAEIDERALGPPVRRLLWIARVWLWVYGRKPRAASLDPVREVALAPPVDRGSYELLAAAGACALQFLGPSGYEPLVRALTAVGDTIEVGIGARCRGRLVSAWHDASRGDVTSGATECEAAAREAMRLGDAEGVVLLAGNLGVLHAMTGRIQVATQVGEAALALPGTARWTTFAELLLIVDLATQVLAGRSDEVAEAVRHAVERPRPTAVGLERLFASRAYGLCGEVIPLPRAEEVLAEGLTVALGNGDRLYSAVIAAERLDLRCPEALHRLVRDGLADVEGDGLMPAVRRLSTARLDADGPRIVAAGLELERMGAVSAASRAMADALRAGVVGDCADAARRGLVRLQRRWDGAPMWWFDDVDDVPTPHQVDIALRVVDSGSAQQVADELVLSRRTVENHLYRVTHALGVSGRDGLRQALEPPW